MKERLQKVIATAGIASRRHAEKLITEGRVSVNNVVVTQMGVKADAEKDTIRDRRQNHFSGKNKALYNLKQTGWICHYTS